MALRSERLQQVCLRLNVGASSRATCGLRDPTKLSQFINASATIVTDAGFMGPWFESIRARGWDCIGRSCMALRAPLVPSAQARAASQGYDEPWCLVTSLGPNHYRPRQSINWYSKQMQIELASRDLKDDRAAMTLVLSRLLQGAPRDVAPHRCSGRVHAHPRRTGRRDNQLASSLPGQHGQTQTGAGVRPSLWIVGNPYRFHGCWQGSNRKIFVYFPFSISKIGRLSTKACAVRPKSFFLAAHY